jgi:signal transduction histidine kinase
MINNILETARMHHLHGKLKTENVILADLLNGLLSEFEDQPPGVQADDIATGISINVDPEQIKIVLNNILTNAVKFSDSESDPIRITVKSRAPHVVVQIADNGIGIPPDELPFIFEPFYRVDKSRTKDTGGYGLGLSLCKTIMEAHGGRIEIDSTPNVGTTVTLFFPE